MNMRRVDELTGARLHPGTDFPRHGSHHRSAMKQWPSHPASGPRPGKERPVGSVDGKNERNLGRCSKARGQPTMGVEDLGARRELMLGCRAKLPPQAGQRTPAERSSQQGREAGVIGDRVAEGRTTADPAHRDPLEHDVTGLAAGADDADGNATADERTRQRAERAAGNITWPMGKVVGQEDDPHRSVPDVGLLEPSQPTRDLAGLLAHAGDHFAEEAESE